MDECEALHREYQRTTEYIKMLVTQHDRAFAIWTAGGGIFLGIGLAQNVIGLILLTPMFILTAMAYQISLQYFIRASGGHAANLERRLNARIGAPVFLWDSSLASRLHHAAGPLRLLSWLGVLLGLGIISTSILSLFRVLGPRCWLILYSSAVTTVFAILLSFGMRLGRVHAESQAISERSYEATPTRE